MYKEIPC